VININVVHSRSDLNFEVAFDTSLALLASVFVISLLETVLTAVAALAGNEYDASLLRATLVAHVILNDDRLHLHAIRKLPDFGWSIFNRVSAVHVSKCVMCLAEAHLAQAPGNGSASVEDDCTESKQLKRSPDHAYAFISLFLVDQLLQGVLGPRRHESSHVIE